MARGLPLDRARDGHAHGSRRWYACMLVNRGRIRRQSRPGTRLGRRCKAAGERGAGRTAQCERALAADDAPVSFPWIAASLRRLGDVLARPGAVADPGLPPPTVVPEPWDLPARPSQRVVITGWGGCGAYGGHQDRWQMLLVLADCNAVPRLN